MIIVCIRCVKKKCSSVITNFLAVRADNATSYLSALSGLAQVAILSPRAHSSFNFHSILFNMVSKSKLASIL